MNSIYVLIPLTISVSIFVKSVDSNFCEPITIPMCTENLSYNYTSFPNSFNHANQEEADLEVNEFWNIFKILCSSTFVHFLCALYAPPCNIANIRVPPCRELCEESRRGCEDLIRQYGLTFPGRLQCEQFPSLLDNAICLFPEQFRQSTDSASVIETTVEREEIVEPFCEPIRSTFCSGHIPYNTTVFPNILNHPSQDVAARELNMYFPLVEMECSPPLLRFFVCSAYNPYCSEAGNSVHPPCRELCEQATTGCTGFNNQLGFVWPKYMKCERFSTRQEDPQCLMSPHLDQFQSTTDEYTSEEEDDGDNVNMSELVEVFRERINGIKESMREVQAENAVLHIENKVLREQVAALKEELAASEGVTVTNMEKFETSITEKLADLKRTIYNSLATTSANISDQIQQSCNN